MKHNRFFVLPYSLHQSHIPHLMGRIVLDPFDPLRRFAPDPSHDGFNPEDIVPNICPEPIPYRSRTDVIRAASSVTLQGSLASYFGAHADRHGSQSVEFESDVVKRYQMINNVVVFQKLMADGRYSALVEQLWDEAKADGVLLVTGFLSTKMTRWTTSAGRGNGVGVNMEVPAGELLGAPIDGNPGMDVSLSREAGHDMTGQVDIEEIFAVAYDVIKHKHALDKKAKHWVATTTVLGDEKRTKAGHLAFGEEDSEEEIDYHPETEEDQTSTFVLESSVLPDAVKSTGKPGFLDFDNK